MDSFVGRFCRASYSLFFVVIGRAQTAYFRVLALAGLNQYFFQVKIQNKRSLVACHPLGCANKSFKATALRASP
jgi:hypothetical protein